MAKVTSCLLLSALIQTFIYLYSSLKVGPTNTLTFLWYLKQCPILLFIIIACVFISEYHFTNRAAKQKSIDAGDFIESAVYKKKERDCNVLGR